ncbi:hypothetical protein [Streptomyces sp. CL12-4]|uniref:hypothetical protein n=1 Tax=Streptomyces sp. CL12-4 TaxID=2810306 RepID=UPI001EFA3C4A|nr:hypothetical protein [Streptomyces sp. CL12-4]MCG8971511.1 hypothetical protein [Streptomyces sp. CL12-4]
MSEQSAPPPGEFGPWLSGQGADAYALVWVDPPEQPAGWPDGPESEPPRLGESGIARPGFDSARIVVQEVVYGREEALRRWLDLNTGARPLAIVTTGPDGLREHTPGELAVARLLHDTDEVRVTRQLADWLHRRSTTAPQGPGLGWSAATAAWACHMRALSDFPPPSVVPLALRAAGQGASTAELIAATGQNVTALLDRLENPYRSHGELVDDWHALQALAADVPAYTGTADWLLDQIALRDAFAQQLRAVLEPDLTDLLHHQAASPHTPAPVLDEQRAAHLAQAHATVRAYTAASCSGRPQEARRIRDAFPAPARALTASGPATAWRRASTTAQRAVEDLAEQRAATLDDDADYLADPRLLHARIAYLSARHGQLNALHDALGRLTFPTEPPATLPEGLTAVAAAQTERRLIEAFGTLDRAAQALDGQITYQRQHGPDAPGTEAELLTTARTALDRLTTTVVPLDENEIRARLQQAMARPTPQPDPAPAGPAPTAPAARSAYDEAHIQTQATSPSTPGIHR